MKVEELKVKQFGEKIANLIMIAYETGKIDNPEQLRKIEKMAKEDYPNQYGSYDDEIPKDKEANP